jgi:CRISPR system Cascade subunit CasD
MKILVFPFAGMAASCGGRSRWAYRSTDAFPSKSQIIGMICCALGWKRDDSRIQPLSDRLMAAVRADRAGVVCTDYQTVHGFMGESHDRMRTANGGYRAAGAGLESHRDYLCDAAFLIAVTGPEEDLNMIYEALQNPADLLYLGRKACIPSIPIIPAFVEYDSMEDALAHVEYSKSFPCDGDVRMAEYDARLVSPSSGTIVRRYDSVTDFKKRQFMERRAVRKPVKMSEVTYVFD